MNAIATIPLHNIEAEQSVLGAILINNAAYHKVADLIEPADFFEPIHRQIFDIAGKLIETGKVASPITLRSYLPADQDIAGMSIGKYLARLCAEATTIVNAPDYALLIRDMAALRGISEIGASLHGIAYSDPVRVSADAIEAIDQIAGRLKQSSTPTVTMAQAATNAVDEIAKAYQRDGAISGITWGLRDLDAKTLGFQRGELTVCAGRPGMGKTAIAITSSLRASEAGHRGLFVSLEMGDVALGQRALADLIFDIQPIPYWRLRSGRVSEKEFDLITDAAVRLGKLPLIIEQQPGLTVAQIAGRARQIKRKSGLDFIVVDHMHLVRASERYSGNRVAEVGEVSSALKSLAKDLGVAMVALCQLSRQVEGREDKRPTLGDLRWSGEIEQDADVVVMLFRESYYLERREPRPGTDEHLAWQDSMVKNHEKLEAIIEKQRQGPIGRVDLFCSIACNAVRDIRAESTLPLGV